MITATIAAIAIGYSTGSIDATPPSRPAGSIPVGHGMELLDDSFNKTPKPKDDSSLPGGRRATLRYVWWSVYVQATGNVEMRTSLTCTHICENPGDHNHGPACKIGGCAAQCPYEGHKTTLTTTSSSSSSRAVSQAISRAQSSMNTVTAKVGASGYGLSAEISGSAARGSSSSVTLGSSISSAVGRSVSGSVDISLGHFNTKPCTSETWWFGTKEYEIRMVIQVFEQDYYSESWVIGGRHGVLPSSGLMLTGEARFVGAAQDVQLGTYQVPSNQPVKKESDLDCGCKPKSVLTPNPHGDHSSLPSGTTKFFVTPLPEEKVFFTNPTNETLVIAYTNFKVEVEPGEEKEIPRGDLTGPIPIDVSKTNGERVMRVVYGADLPGTSTRPEGWEQSYRVFEAAMSNKSKGTVEATRKVEEGTAFEMPEIGDEVLVNSKPQEFSLVQVMIAAGMSTGSIPVMDGSTPIMEVRGSMPDGSRLVLGTGANQTTADTFMKIKGIDGETVAAFVKFDGIDGEALAGDAEITLKLMSRNGETLSETPVSIQKAEISLDMTPRTGPAGSTATLIIDTTQVIAFMAQNSDAHAKQFDLILNFGGGGGATGPSRIPMDPSGITRVQVTRGAVPGNFQVAVGLERAAGWNDDDSDPTVSGGGGARGGGVETDPGQGLVKGG